MVATAGAPEYNSADIHSRWIVVDNEVKTNSERGMIEVRRTLSRIVQRPREQAQKDRRTTQFSVQLLPVEPPTVEFVSQGYSFTPVRDAHEAEHYFSALDDMLIPIHNESPN
jgi:hypothetical protein